MLENETIEQSTTMATITKTIKTICNQQNDDQIGNELELDALRREHSNIDNLLNALLNEATKCDSTEFQFEIKNCNELLDKVS